MSKSQAIFFVFVLISSFSIIAVQYILSCRIFLFVFTTNSQLSSQDIQQSSRKTLNTDCCIFQKVSFSAHPFPNLVLQSAEAKFTRMISAIYLSFYSHLLADRLQNIFCIYIQAGCFYGDIAAL